MVGPSTPQRRLDRLTLEARHPDSWKKTIYSTFDDPSYSTPAKVISVVMMLVILISTLAFILETELLDGGAFFSVRDDAQVSASDHAERREPHRAAESLCHHPSPSAAVATSALGRRVPPPSSRRLPSCHRSPTAPLATAPKHAVTCTATTLTYLAPPP